MSTASITRPTEAVCPPYCTGHDDRYQGWEDRVEGGKLREHCSVGALVNGVGVFINQTESDDHSLTAPAIEVFVEVAGADFATLTPEQAVTLACELFLAARRATGDEA